MSKRSLTAPRTFAGLLALIGAGLLALPATGVAADVTGGSAEWGVKESWRNYIVNVPPGGTITASDGATQEPGNGVFDFTGATGEIDPDAGTADVTLDGTVEFDKPAHFLSVTLEDPRIAIDGATGTLYVDGSSQGTPFTDTDIATLDLSGISATVGSDEVAYPPIPATLTENGSTIFGGSYSAGTEIDPISFTVAAQIGDDPVDAGAIKPGRRQQRLGKSRTAKLAVVNCKIESCELKSPKKLRARIKGGANRGKTVRFRVKAPKRLAEGERGTVLVKADKRTARKLGRKGKAKLTGKLKLTGAGGKTVKETARLKVKR